MRVVSVLVESMNKMVLVAREQPVSLYRHRCSFDEIFW